MNVEAMKSKRTERRRSRKAGEKDIGSRQWRRSTVMEKEDGGIWIGQRNKGRGGSNCISI